ncbi:MAG: hypothetical protein AB7U35_04275 [Sphingobium sp.]
MAEPTPSAIRTFETLQIVSVAIGFAHAGAIMDLGIWDAIVIVGPIMILTLLVSRKRKNWARLLLAILFLGNLIFMVTMRHLVFARGYPLMTLAVTMLQGAALLMVFTKPASEWINTRPRS